MKISVSYQLARFLVTPKPITLVPVLLRSRQPSQQRLIHSLHSLLRDPINLERNSILLRNIRNMASVRQNFAEECEAGLNRQINLELYASYVYSSMAFHFDRDDVALPGFHKFFKSRSDDERGHAEKLMKYQNMRGGRILLQDIRKPECDEWGNGLEAMTSALKLEKSVNQSLLDLHKVADSNHDVQFADFLEGEFLKEQVEDIKEIANYVKQLTRVGPGIGEYMFDKETLQELK